MLRILRLTRVVRVFKMSRNFQGLVLLLTTFQARRPVASSRRAVPPPPCPHRRASAHSARRRPCSCSSSFSRCPSSSSPPSSSTPSRRDLGDESRPRCACWRDLGERLAGRVGRVPRAVRARGRERVALRIDPSIDVVVHRHHDHGRRTPAEIAPRLRAGRHGTVSPAALHSGGLRRRLPGDDPGPGRRHHYDVLRAREIAPIAPRLHAPTRTQSPCVFCAQSDRSLSSDHDHRREL